MTALPKGFVEYKRREFCNDVKCSRQLELNAEQEGSPGYEKIREKCKTACLYTTYQFHHWLIQKEFLIIKPCKT
ncbi:MAG: hypothetical protein AB1498_03745 [bacterium]